MEKFEIRLGFASPNFKFFHNPYSPSAEYEAIFSITRHQPGGICTNIFNISWPNAIGYSGHCGQDMSRNAIGYLVGDTDGGRQVETLYNIFFYMAKCQLWAFNILQLTNLQRAEETSFYPAILM